VQKGTYEGQFGLKVLDPRVYIAVAYLNRTNNNGYPNLSGVGFGVQKLPDLQNAFSFGASFYYYPQIKGTYNTGTIFDSNGNVVSPSQSLTLSYTAMRYDVGVTYRFLKTFPVYAEAGYFGEQDANKTNAPSNWNEGSFYVGLGFKFF
jgi:predicted porin